MCGIAGIYHFNEQPVCATQLQHMANRMIHRGPDDEGFYTENAVGLVMRRLAIIDTEGGHQPISNETNTVWVVMNGEIYNYIELRKELQAHGHVFRTQSDTEVIVHLYEEEGMQAIEKLNGMFAFALYDSEKECLWVARDRLGIKPLYYAAHSQKLLFSSDLAALNSILDHTSLDEQAFLSYLAFAYVPQEKSIFKGIKKLLPGHWLRVDRSGLQQKQYWHLQSFESWQGTIQEAEEQLTSLLTSSVKLQLRSDVPVGLSLSGGVDSGAILAMAVRDIPNLMTFTIDFQGKAQHDTHAARQLAKHFATKHVEIPFAATSISRQLDALMPFMDEPISDSAIVSSYVVAQQAQQHGVKVLLSGAGGDELFGGYHRHFFPQRGSTQWLSERLPLSIRRMMAMGLRYFNRDKSLRMQHPAIAYGTSLSGANLAVFHDLLSGSIVWRDFVARYVDAFKQDVGNVNYHYQRMLYDLRHYLVDNILALSDKATMASSVEGRVPLLDHRLVEFAFSLPVTHNLLDGKTKGLFKKALSTYLPMGLLNRSKDGFSAPMAKWAMSSLGQDMHRELVVDTIDFYRDLFNRHHFEKWVVKVLKGHVAAETIFNLYVFSKWYRYHVKGVAS